MQSNPINSRNRSLPSSSFNQVESPDGRCCVCVCVCPEGEMRRDGGMRNAAIPIFFFGEMQTRRGENLGQFNRDGKRTLAFALVGLNLLPYRRRSPPRTNHSSGFFFRPCRLFRLHMTALLTS